MVQWTSIPAVHISTKTYRNPGKRMVGEASRFYLHRREPRAGLHHGISTHPQTSEPSGPSRTTGHFGDLWLITDLGVNLQIEYISEP